MLSGANLCKVTFLGEETTSIPRMLFRVLFALFQSRLELAAENTTLRQQLAILGRTAKRPKLRQRERVFTSALPVIGPPVTPDEILGRDR